MKLKTIFLTLFLGSLVTHTPTTKAVDWAAFKDFAINAPLEHPVAFCFPPVINIPTLAVLYGLKNYQNTISPLWAYATLPLVAGLFVACDSHQNDKDKEVNISLPKRLIIGALAFIGYSAAIAFASAVGLAEAYCFSK